MRRAPFNFFKLPVQHVRWCHTNSSSFLTPDQLSKFKYLGNVVLTHFRTCDFSWHEIDLVKTLMEGNSEYAREPLSVEDAFAQLDAFKKLPINALCEQQLDLLNELYPYGLRREHLDLAKITPTNADTLTHDEYKELVHIISIFDMDLAAICYTGGWIEFFKKAFQHHVMRKVTGFDVYEDPRGISHNYDVFFAESLQNPALLKESVEKTLGEIKGMNMVDLALYSYGFQKKDLGSIERNYDSYWVENEKLWAKRLESKKPFATTEDSNSPKP